jgi:hypothetical protein
LPRPPATPSCAPTQRRFPACLRRPRTTSFVQKGSAGELRVRRISSSPFSPLTDGRVLEMAISASWCIYGREGATTRSYGSFSEDLGRRGWSPFRLQSRWPSLRDFRAHLFTIESADSSELAARWGTRSRWIEEVTWISAVVVRATDLVHARDPRRSCGCCVRLGVEVGDNPVDWGPCVNETDTSEPAGG